MRKGAETALKRRGTKPPRAESLSELPMVAALLVAAVVVAVLAAGGPVLELVSGFDAAWNR